MGPLILFGNNRRRLFFSSLGTVRVQIDQGRGNRSEAYKYREKERERESEMTEIMWRRSRLT